MNWLQKISQEIEQPPVPPAPKSKIRPRKPAKPKRIPQTETPEFQQWFSGSKVVDANGNPMVVYHGTQHDFDTFEVGAKGSNSNVFGSWDVQRAGMFFSEDPKMAESFANQADEGARVGQNIKPVYLSIGRPIDLRQGFSFAALNTMDDYGLNTRYYNNVRHMWEIFDYESGGQNLVKVLKQMGHDGAIIYDEDSTTWVAFDPNQIKSATGNVGTFDENNPSILARNLEIKRPRYAARSFP